MIINFSTIHFLPRALGNGELSCESSTSSGHQLKVSNGKPSSNKDESSNGSRAKIAVRFHGMDRLVLSIYYHLDVAQDFHVF